MTKTAQTQTQTPTQLQTLATNNAVATMQAVARTSEKLNYTIDEMKLVGRQNSTILTLLINNEGYLDSESPAVLHKSDVTIGFGTPLNSRLEASLLPDNLISDADKFWLAENSAVGVGVDFFKYLQDNIGTNMDFLKLLNERFLRHPVLVRQIEVITADDPIGQKQKGIAIKRITVPYNSASDSAVSAGAYIPLFTQYTAVQLLTKPIILGEFTGFLYKILQDASVQMNIYLEAIDQANFVNVKE